MKDYKDPYLAVQDPKIMMKGAGAPRSTVFGALGRIHSSDGVGLKTLGGLVADTKSPHPLGKGTKMSVKQAEREYGNTDRHILGHSAKTHIPGCHMSQVPYPGLYMSAVGKRL